MTGPSSHPAVAPDAVERLRQRLGRAVEPAPATGAPEAAPPAPATGTQAALVRAKALARRAAAPAVARARRELTEAAGREHEGLRAEVAALRDELERTRTEHAAELAALHEQVRGLLEARTDRSSDGNGPGGEADAGGTAAQR